jgi:hypothetical protein
VREQSPGVGRTKPPRRPSSAHRRDAVRLEMTNTGNRAAGSLPEQGQSRWQGRSIGCAGTARAAIVAVVNSWRDR